MPWRGTCAKNTFPDRAAAKAWARRVKDREDGRSLFPYECQGCGLWHLTSQSPREQRRIAKRMGHRGPQAGESRAA